MLNDAINKATVHEIGKSIRNMKVCTNMDSNEVMRSLRQFANSYFSNRKLVFITLASLALLLYMWPSLLRRKREFNGDPVAQACIFDRLAQYDQFGQHSQIHYFNPDLNYPDKSIYSDDSEPRNMVPFVGNGKIGISLYGNEAGTLRIAKDIHTNSIDQLTTLTPLVSVNIQPYDTRSTAYVVEYTRGQATQITCYKTNTQVHDCVVVTSRIYAHRKFANYLVQDITIHNPLSHSIQATLDRNDQNCRNRKATSAGTECSHELANIGSISVWLPGFEKVIAVKEKSSTTIHLVTVINTDGSDISSDGMKASQVDSARLEKDHVEIWETLWHVGFHISHSFATQTLNARAINATRYVVLANTRALIHEAGVSNEEKSIARNHLLDTNLCYSAHNTLLYPSNLWSGLATMSEIVRTAYIWKLTLEKSGCHGLVEAGADGIARAMVFSFGGFKFVPRHFEFNTFPEELHRDFEYTNLPYGNLSEMTIAVRVGDDNKAQIWVSHRPRNSITKLYACDGGCIDAPIEISTNQFSTFPVKLTKPITSILYVSPDKRHLEDLRHTIHVKEVADAPAHEHALLAQHKYGHRLGGLPASFWLCLGILIIAFHAFLFRLIYNEYMRPTIIAGYRRVPKFSM